MSIVLLRPTNNPITPGNYSVGMLRKYLGLENISRIQARSCESESKVGLSSALQRITFHFEIQQHKYSPGGRVLTKTVLNVRN